MTQAYIEKTNETQSNTITQQKTNEVAKKKAKQIVIYSSPIML